MGPGRRRKVAIVLLTVTGTWRFASEVRKLFLKIANIFSFVGHMISIATI